MMVKTPRYFQSRTSDNTSSRHNKGDFLNMAEIPENEEIDEEAQSEAPADESLDDALEELDDDLAFLRDDSDNLHFYLGSKAYYEERDYEDAIAKFQAAIERENEQLEADDEDEQFSAEISDEIIAQSMYWMGESYVKVQQFNQAIEVFEELADDFDNHYLGLAAQRRAEVLKAHQQAFPESE
jgi:TolA-binding protein